MISAKQNPCKINFRRNNSTPDGMKWEWSCVDKNEGWGELRWSLAGINRRYNNIDSCLKDKAEWVARGWTHLDLKRKPTEYALFRIGAKQIAKFIGRVMRLSILNEYTFENLRRHKNLQFADSLQFIYPRFITASRWKRLNDRID